MLNEKVYGLEAGLDHPKEEQDVVGYVDHVFSEGPTGVTIQLRSDDNPSKDTHYQTARVVRKTATVEGQSVSWLELAE